MFRDAKTVFVLCMHGSWCFKLLCVFISVVDASQLFVDVIR